MASEPQPNDVHPVRLTHAADAIMRGRTAVNSDSPAEQARAKAEIEQYNKDELMTAADFLRRMGMGPKTKH